MRRPGHKPEAQKGENRKVEQEIDRLSDSQYVKLARAEQRLRYRRRQYLYQLRNFEKKGRELAKAGYTLENVNELMKACDEERRQ